MPEIQKVTDKLNRIVWNQRQVSQKPDIKSNGKSWLMDTMPFNAVLKEKLTDDKPLQYLCEGKYISFKPVGGTLSKGELRADKRSVAYKDGLGAGISLEVEVSQSHWKKLIKIDSLSAIDTSQKFVEFKFLVDSDFDIPERENKKPRIKLGENSFIEVSQAWDSSPVIEDAETGETSENKIPVRSFFHRVGSKLYFIKQIPTEWLKTAVFPVWTDVDIVYGSAQEFESGQADWSQCCEIDTNKFVVVYKDVDDGNAGKARVGTVSGTTITWGAINEFYSSVSLGHQLGVCKLDTDKFVVVYAGAGGDGYARVGTVATRTISWGTAKEFETGDTEWPSCCQLGTDKFAIVYNDETAGDLGTVVICTVATTTITSGTPVAFEGRIQHCRCCKLDTDKLVAVYADFSDGNKGKACAFTVVGTVPTPGTIKEFETDSAIWKDCAQLDTDKFVVAWQNEIRSAGVIEICTVSGTTITEGAEVEFNPDNAYYIGLAKIDATHFVVVYRDLGNADKGTSRYCSFSGTTITLDGEEIFHDAQMQYSDVCLISADKIAVVYQDNADVNNIGEAIIGDTPIPVIAYTKILSDSVAIADAPSKAMGQVQGDSVAIADVVTSLVSEFKRSFSDTVDIAESSTLVAEFKRALADTVTVGETVTTKAIGMAKADSVSIAEALVKAIGVAEADSLNITDAVTKAIGVFEADSMAIADSIALVVEYKRALADTVAIADALTKGVGQSQADTIAVAESTALVVEFKRALADSLAIADGVSKAIGVFEADSLAITDAFTKVSEFARSLADTVNISDTIDDVVEFFLTASDTMTIADAVSKEVGIPQSDSISLADSISKGMGLNEVDSIAMSELLQMVQDTVYTARLHYWTGSAWNKALFKRWTGSDWEVVDTSNV